MARSATLLCIVLGVVAVSASVADAGGAAELAEWLLRQGSRYADDIAGKGAKELTIELEKLSARAGDDAVTLMIKSGKPGALKLVREFGDRAPDAVQLIAKHGEPGKLLLQQGGSITIDVFRRYGDNGVLVLIEHGPSTGGKMLSVYGKGLVGKTLSRASTARLRHWLPEIEKAEPQLRQTFAKKLRDGGDDFVVWVHKRWKEVAVCGGLTVATVSAYKVGDGIADSIPDPTRSPLGWLVWWSPFLIIVGIVAVTWMLRHILSARIISHKSEPPS